MQGLLLLPFWRPDCFIPAQPWASLGGPEAEVDAGPRRLSALLAVGGASEAPPVRAGPRLRTLAPAPPRPHDSPTCLRNPDARRRIYAASDPRGETRCRVADGAGKVTGLAHALLTAKNRRAKIVWRSVRVPYLEDSASHG